MIVNHIFKRYILFKIFYYTFQMSYNYRFTLFNQN